MNKITVLTYLHENETQFDRCISGLERQTYKDFDWVILSHKMPQEPIGIPHQVLLLPEGMHVRSDVMNWAFPQIKTKYIAYNDSDDSSLPNRLKLQLDFMENNPKVDISSGMFFVNETENTWPLHEKHDMIASFLLINCPMVHPAIIIRNRIGHFGVKFKYNSNYVRAQDYDFWYQCIKSGLRFHNLQTQVISYHVPPNKPSNDTQEQSAIEIRNQILHEAGIVIPITLYQIYHDFCKLQHLDQVDLIKLLDFVKKHKFKKMFKNAKKAFAWQLDLYMKHHQLSNNSEFVKLKLLLEKESLIKRLFS
ncbi:MAG: glycosyltransferase [Bacteroidota bacterium]|nr:glycosyltransferase [Bacteroidota bacterium]